MQIDVYKVVSTSHKGVDNWNRLLDSIKSAATELGWTRKIEGVLPIQEVRELVGKLPFSLSSLTKEEIW